MLTLGEYRALLGRFFELARIEKLVTAKLRMATAMRADEQLLAPLHEELRLIQKEKLKLVSDLQEFMLASETSPLFVPAAQQQAHNAHTSNIYATAASGVRQ